MYVVETPLLKIAEFVLSQFSTDGLFRAPRDIFVAEDDLNFSCLGLSGDVLELEKLVSNPVPEKSAEFLLLKLEFAEKALKPESAEVLNMELELVLFKVLLPPKSENLGADESDLNPESDNFAEVEEKEFAPKPL